MDEGRGPHSGTSRVELRVGVCEGRQPGADEGKRL